MHVPVSLSWTHRLRKTIGWHRNVRLATYTYSRTHNGTLAYTQHAHSGSMKIINRNIIKFRKNESNIIHSKFKRHISPWTGASTHNFTTLRFTSLFLTRNEQKSTGLILSSIASCFTWNSEYENDVWLYDTSGRHRLIVALMLMNIEFYGVSHDSENWMLIKLMNTTTLFDAVDYPHPA